MAEILIVEDDNNINSLLCELLKNENSVTSAFSGTEAMMIFNSDVNRFDLILLDLMLPGKSGEDIIREIRQVSAVPIIVLTAKGDTNTLVDILEMGADDYISKPFDVREVKARAKSHLRKKMDNHTFQEEVLKFEDLTLNISSRTAFVGENPITLTQKEFDMLSLFLHEPKRVFTKEILYTKVWGDMYYGDDNTINVHISRLRSKIKEYMQKDIIDTVWGVGFRLKVK